MLLGVEPDRPEVAYGWIEPATPLLTLEESRDLMVWSVRRFWEKPSVSAAETLQTPGWLWNCFATVARVPTLRSVILDALPELSHAFARLQPVPGTSAEPRGVRDLYERLRPTDFSRQVLAARPARLAVLPIRGVTWNDLGEPGRVPATRRQIETLAPPIQTTAGPGLRAPGVGREPSERIDDGVGRVTCCPGARRRHMSWLGLISMNLASVLLGGLVAANGDDAEGADVAGDLQPVGACHTPAGA